MNLEEKWRKAYTDSNRRFNNRTFILADPCVDEEGLLCPFLRKMTIEEKGVTILFTRCVFSRCVKRYPEAGDWEELK